MSLPPRMASYPAFPVHVTNEEYSPPSSAPRNWGHFACMIPYEMLRFPGFLKISAGIVFVASQCSTTTCIHIALDSRGQHS